MIGHHSHFRENDDLPLWRDPVVKKKPAFSNACTLITHKIMRNAILGNDLNYIIYRVIHDVQPFHLNKGKKETYTLKKIKERNKHSYI